MIRQRLQDDTDPYTLPYRGEGEVPVCASDDYVMGGLVGLSTIPPEAASAISTDPGRDDTPLSTDPYAGPYRRSSHPFKQEVLNLNPNPNPNSNSNPNPNPNPRCTTSPVASTMYRLTEDAPEPSVGRVCIRILGGITSMS